MVYGTVRVRNVISTHSADDDNTDPLVTEIEADGQRHTIGPNDKVVLPESFHAAASVLNATIEVDDAAAATKYPQQDAVTG